MHITEGVWLGNGDPSIVFEPDLEPEPDFEADLLLPDSLLPDYFKAHFLETELVPDF